MRVANNCAAAPWRISTLVAMSLFVTACVSHQAVDNRRDKIEAELEPGDRVEIELRSGEAISFRVTDIGEAGLTGNTSTDITLGKIVTVPYEDIERLERVDQRPLVVIGTAVAVPFAILFLFLVIAVSTF